MRRRGTIGPWPGSTARRCIRADGPRQGEHPDWGTLVFNYDHYEVRDFLLANLNEGPCITAALERRTARSGSLGEEKMWPRFGPRVGRLGVHSALPLPLLLPDRVVGAINVYAHGKDVFDEHAAELGELFAKPAAVAVHNVQILAQALTLSAQLQAGAVDAPGDRSGDRPAAGT